MIPQENESIFNKEIQLSDIYYSIIRRKYLIIVFLLISVVASIIYSSVDTKEEPTYKAVASMVVNAKYNQNYIAGQSEIPTSTDIYLAQDLVNTYTLVLKSDRVMADVIKQLGLDITPDNLRSCVNLTSTKDTQVLFLTVNYSDKLMAVEIAKAIMEVAPQVMMDTVELGSINVLDHATISNTSSGNVLLKNTALASMIGLIIGVGLAILIGIFFSKVKNADDIDRTLSIPTMGEIMHFSQSNKKTGIILSDIDRWSPFFESFIFLSSTFKFIAKEQNLKKILITSALKDEGKTLVSVNLSLALASIGKKVLLIDCDIRSQNVYKDFNISRNQANNFYKFISMSNNDVDLSSCIVKVQDGLHVIPFLNVPQSEYREIFTTHAFINSINLLAGQYDYVIMDSSPAYITAETLSLVDVSDGVLFVVKQEHTPEAVLLNTVEKLVGVGANMFGCVLNDIKYCHVGSGYFCKYKYSQKEYYYENKVAAFSKQSKVKSSQSGNENNDIVNKDEANTDEDTIV